MVNQHGGDLKTLEVMTSTYPIDNLESLATLDLERSPTKKKKKGNNKQKQTNKQASKHKINKTQKATNMSNTDPQKYRDDPSCSRRASLDFLRKQTLSETSVQCPEHDHILLIAGVAK